MRDGDRSIQSSSERLAMRRDVGNSSRRVPAARARVRVGEERSWERRREKERETSWIQGKEKERHGDGRTPSHAMVSTHAHIHLR